MDELDLWIESAQHALSRNEHIDARDVLAYMVRLAELVRERTEPPPDPEARTHMVIDLTDGQGLDPRPLGKWGPFTKAEAEAFIAKAHNPNALMALPSKECR